MRPRPVAPRAYANRVSYSLTSVREWFVNGPLGVEQGFDLARRPGGAGPLRVELAVSGARVRLDGHGGAVLSMATGGAVGYRTVSAVDARGRPLPARLALGRGRLSILVDDRRASYPVHVDPFLQQAKLVGGATSASPRRALAWQCQGTRTRRADRRPRQTTTGSGAAWVFTRSEGIWTQQGPKAGRHRRYSSTAQQGR